MTNHKLGNLTIWVTTVNPMLLLRSTKSQVHRPFIPFTEIGQVTCNVNPLVTNGIAHPYPIDESFFFLRGTRSNFSVLFHFYDENHVSKQNSPRWDAASHLGLFGLPMSHKKTPGLYRLTTEDPYAI